MPANIDPIYCRAPDIQWTGVMTAANTTADLTSGTIYTAFTADATNGGLVNFIRFRSTPAGNTTATVARIWVNNGSTTGTAANNTLLDEITLPATTASGTAATFGYDWSPNPQGLRLPAGYKVIITIHTASANGWFATVIGGKF